MKPVLRVALFMALSLLLASCALLNPSQETAAPTILEPAPVTLPVDRITILPPSDVIQQAETLRKEGNWSQAIEVLKEANRQYPGHGELEAVTQRLEANWQNEKRRLEERILVTETDAMLKIIPMLEQLERGESDDYLLKSRLLFWQQFLQTKVDPLIVCGLDEEARDLWLARKCLKLAQRIAPSDETAAHLQRVSKKINQVKQALREKKERAEQQQRTRKVETLLAEAEHDMERGALSSALLKLDEAIRQEPENLQVRELLDEVQAALSQQVESLVKLGDRLYREEQIGPAIAVWEAALKLDPNEEGISEKIMRARKVMEKLQHIRSRESEGE